MNLTVLLSISSIYLALVGVGYLISPSGILFGAMDPGAPNALVAQPRGVSSTAAINLAIAVAFFWRGRASMSATKV